MSRVGKKQIDIPNDIQLKVDDRKINVKGPKGELNLTVHPKILIEQSENAIIVNVKDPDDKAERSLWGTTRKLISNMVEGVSNGFEKKLEVNGIGYKVSVSDNKIVLSVGFSHPVDFVLPDGISAAVEKNVIVLSGIDKQLVGEIAAQIRKIRKPEPYKGKGIKYVDEQIIRKAGKTAKSSA
ncbi:MAG: 50S ribosomal protein L6 [bacterium]